MSAADMLGPVLDAAVIQQPWYRRWSNTVVMACTGLVTLATWLTATWTDMPPVVASIIGGIVLVASVLIQRSTRNGLTPRGTRETIDALAPKVDQAIADAAATARQTAGDLAGQARIVVPGSVDDLIDIARSRGWTEHDPRFLGLPPADAARRFLDALSGRHAKD